MGWKRVKEHYGIRHIVCVTEAGICIGSGYVHNLITITPDGSIKRLFSLGRGEPFDGWVAAMEADRETLLRLMAEPDEFSASRTVYTFDYDGNIIAKTCETPGWPNVTHDGDLMYNNTFSTNRKKVVRWARRNILAGAERARWAARESERDLARHRERLKALQRALATLRAKRKLSGSAAGRRGYNTAQ